MTVVQTHLQLGMMHSQNVKSGILDWNGFFNTFGSVRQTDRQKVMHRSPQCIGTGARLNQNISIVILPSIFEKPH